MTSIEIGGGHLVQAGWTNLDPTHGMGEWQRPAQVVPWPAPDGSVSAIRTICSTSCFATCFFRSASSSSLPRSPAQTFPKRRNESASSSTSSPKVR